jgi:hypothetical protein
METLKTYNMKVVQNNESYNFAFGVISKFQITFETLNLNLELKINSFSNLIFYLVDKFYSNHSIICTISNH